MRAPAIGNPLAWSKPTGPQEPPTQPSRARRIAAQMNATAAAQWPGALSQARRGHGGLAAASAAQRDFQLHRAIAQPDPLLAASLAGGGCMPLVCRAQTVGSGSSSCSEDGEPERGPWPFFRDQPEEGEGAGWLAGERGSLAGASAGPQAVTLEAPAATQALRRQTVRVDREAEAGGKGNGSTDQALLRPAAESNGTAGSNGGVSAPGQADEKQAKGQGRRAEQPMRKDPVLETTSEELWENVLNPSVEYLPEKERALVRDALDVAFWAHDGQRRKSGEPFIIHPVEVARILAGLEMDWETLVAGLLHDTVEDTDRISFEQIEAKYGPAVRRIVEGETKVSKLGKVQQVAAPSEPQAAEPFAGDSGKKGKADVKADDLQQMFLAMTEEVRVIIVKLADRLHNMRTLVHMPPHKQEHIARETLRVFAPLARLLGMYRIKAELEDLSFRYAHPKDYARVTQRLADLQEEQREGLQEAQAKLEAAIGRDQFLGHMTSGAQVLCRCKEPYSVFRKVLDRECRLEEIHGVGQLRVVLALRDDLKARDPSFAQQVCYHVLGLVHSMWPPIPGSVKDYIATPKPNGYQSLHTTVLPLGSRALFPLEVQIRTEEMDRLAEFGITSQLAAATAAATAAAQAAAAKLSNPFKEHAGSSLTEPFRGGGTPGSGVQGERDGAGGAAVQGAESERTQETRKTGVQQQQQDFARRVSWLNAIRDWQEEFVGNLSAREFVDTVTGDLLGSRIFVFTPKGEVKNLPKDATVIDYAYSIHSDVGNQMYAAKVNGNFVPPTFTLSNADIVEVLTYPAHASSLKGYVLRKDWIKHAKTRSARHKLTKFLRDKASEVTDGVVQQFAESYDSDSGSDSSDSSAREIVHEPDNVGAGAVIVASTAGVMPPRPTDPRSGNSAKLDNLVHFSEASSPEDTGNRTWMSPALNRVVGPGQRHNGGWHEVGLKGSSGGSSGQGIVAADALQDLQAWQEQTVKMWHHLSGRQDPVLWLCIQVYDRTGLLSEASKILTDGGLLILTHAGRTNQEMGLGVMLFEVSESSSSDLDLVAWHLSQMQGVIGYSMGCTWDDSAKFWA